MQTTTPWPVAEFAVWQQRAAAAVLLDVPVEETRDLEERVVAADAPLRSPSPEEPSTVQDIHPPGCCTIYCLASL